MFVLVFFGLADVEFVLRSLFTSGCSRLVLEFLLSVKIWYTFGIHSKKRRYNSRKRVGTKQTNYYNFMLGFPMPVIQAI
jgi:hypothetical protein